MAAPQQIRLWAVCLKPNFEHEVPAFQVLISTDAPVADIQYNAWRLHPALMRSINCSELTVWKIKKPVRRPLPAYETGSAEGGGLTNPQHVHGTRSDDSFELLIEKIQSSGVHSHAEILDIGEDVTKHFKEDSERRVQLFVLLPAQRHKPEPSSNVPSSMESLQDPGVEAIKEVTALSPLSDCLGAAGRELRQKIYIGRPEGRFCYPNAIFHRHLAKLHYDLERLQAPNHYHDSEELSATEMKFLDVSRSFLRNALNDYENEEARWSSSRQFFTRIFGNPGHEQKGIPKSDTDSTAVGVPDVVWGTAQDKGGKRILPHVILKVKKEKGCEFERTIVSFQDTKFFRSTLFPVILIGLNGHSLEISTVLTLERIVVNQLLILDLRDGFGRSSMVRRLVRIASALAECGSRLEEQYKQVMQQGSSADRCRPCFPQPTLDPRSPSSSSLPVLTYKKRLNDRNESFQIRDNPSPQDLRSLFVARLVVDDGSEEPDVVVNAELYACHRVIGNLFMVVMERVKGKNMKAHELREEPFKATVFDDITEALKLLQERDFVHGDLRAVNVMIDAEVKAKLIDFDWAGKSGTARYPVTINKDSLRNEWHPDVEAGGLMETDHDTFVLDSVLKRKYMFSAA
ncbi:hypothetical protein BJV74DRAFT_882649 [Russula compacta]|nr:hypothetical protein BJV74DRAFT_882649 [Russula compacta]